MKLFFKHLLRSIARRPLQPIVLVFTMMLSVAVSVMSFGLGRYSTEEIEMVQAATYGSADLSISLNSTSKSRFMFTKQAEEVLGDRAAVAGLYELPMFMDNKSDTVFGVATDFYEIGNIFSLQFVEYGELTSANLSEVAVISKNFAEERGLSVGDCFEVELLGGQKSYTVAAISPNRFMNSYDIMVDMTGVVRLIAADSLLISALGKDFKPYSTIYIDVLDGIDVNDCIELLRTVPAFSENTIEVVAEFAAVQANTQNFTYVVDVIILLSSILTIAVTFCCFYILAAERTEENAVFNAAGAKPLLLNLMQYAEIAIYWFVGSLLGVALSIPLVRFMVSYADFVYSTADFDALSVLKSVGILLLSCMATVTVFLLSRRRRKKPKNHNVGVSYPITVTLFTLALIVILFLIPGSKAFVPAVVCIAALLFTLFCVAPLLLKLFMRLLNSAFDKKFKASPERKAPTLRYALKNVLSVRVLHNFSRLVALLTSIGAICIIIILSCHGHVKSIRTVFSGDYIVLNSTEGCYGKIVECDSVGHVNKLYVSGNTALVSASDISAFSQSTGIEVMPQGNQAVLSSGQAASRDIRVGDFFTVELDNLEFELQVIDVVRTSANFIVFDCENFGVNYNMLLVSGAESVSSDELMHELTDRTALEFAAVATLDSLVETKMDTINIYLKSANILLVAIVTFALIAMIDNLAQSYRSRREDFELYRCSGMSLRSIKLMKLFEVLTSLIFGLVLGLVVCFIGAFIIQRGMLAMRFDTLYSFMELFR